MARRKQASPHVEEHPAPAEQPAELEQPAGALATDEGGRPRTDAGGRPITTGQETADEA